ncbi:MAG: 3-phosphoshikimate 1-carboxyvinyltransferase, partial [Firmicutes bacterium]|nr:3-phosphoshikimate 1-carboxyvinyltransferase [Bacillota bacterium]
MTSELHIHRLPSGQIFLPPSKSVGHRALICAALAGGGTVHNPGENEDIRATLRCLEALKNGETLLNCGESGSTLRFLIPLAALEARPVTFTGQGRLMDRPLGVYEDCLGTKGVTFIRNPNTKTLTVCGPLQAGSFHLPGDVSSQFITGLLLALPLRPEDSTIYMTTPLQSASYVDLTLSVLKEYG